MLDPELASAPFCYLTTTGRRTGRPHTVEIWFGISGASLYLLAGAGQRSDWVRNARKQPEVSVRIGETTYEGQARTVAAASEEDALARRLLLAKYAPGYGGDLTNWGRTALPVAIDLSLNQEPERGPAS